MIGNNPAVMTAKTVIASGNPRDLLEHLGEGLL